jgi:hypothetical protein
MRTLLAPTEDFIKLERTELDADAAAGSNVTLTLKNNSGMADNTFIVIGREGSEQAEIQKINQAVTAGVSVRVATLLFPHKKGEPITTYRYDKRKFYGALTSTGSYTELTGDGSPVAIQVDDPQGTRLEYSGSTYEYFKATYYNSVSGLETDIADSDAVNGDESARYTSIYSIRVQAGLTNNPYIGDGRIERKRIQAENEINSVLYRFYTLPLDEVPPLIQRVCELLAAGYVDFEEYGPDGQGVKWLGEARGILKSLKDGVQFLIGVDGTELERTSGAHGIISYPDEVDDSRGPRQFFKMGQKF